MMSKLFSHLTNRLRIKDSVNSHKQTEYESPKVLDNRIENMPDTLGLIVLQSPQDANIEYIECVRLSWRCVSNELAVL